MTQAIHHLLSTFHLNDSLVTLDSHPDIRLENTHCSTFIRKHRVLIKGELANPESSKRNAVVALCDPETGQSKGESESDQLANSKGAG